MRGWFCFPPLIAAAFQRDLDWPVAGRIIGRSGRAVGAPGAASSDGIEIAVLAGDSVRAVHEGTVAHTQNRFPATATSSFSNMVAGRIPSTDIWRHST
jgi:murein DD-endopeptidase MepM/ murein hydrolase activator NlpD